MSSIYTGVPLLSPKDIRLLKLKPSKNLGDPLRGELHVADLAKSGDFEALSYTWDPPIDNQVLQGDVIELSGLLLEITGNLSNALRRLRLTGDSRILWVDAICISQGDNKERGHQVGVMARIFSRATRVLAWLGEDTDGKDGVFVLKSRCNAKQFCQDMDIDEATLNEDRRQPWALPRPLEKLLKTFAKRRYFTRRWVVQEQFVARKVLFVCGKAESDWENFQSTIFRASHLLDVSLLYTGFDRIRSKASTVSKHISGVVDTLQTFSNTKCTDSRDFVFALSGMWRHVTLQVDYSMSATEVCVAFAEAIVFLARFSIDEELVDLLFVAAYQVSRRPRDPSYSVLPSWIPDWTQDVPRASSRIEKIGYERGLAANVADGNRLRITLAWWGKLRCSLTVGKFPLNHVYLLQENGNEIDITENEFRPRGVQAESVVDGCVLCSPFYSRDNDHERKLPRLILKPNDGGAEQFRLIASVNVSLPPLTEWGYTRPPRAKELIIL